MPPTILDKFDTILHDLTLFYVISALFQHDFALFQHNFTIPTLIWASTIVILNYTLCGWAGAASEAIWALRELELRPLAVPVQYRRP